MTPTAENFAAFAEFIAAHTRFIVTTHDRPDGDACGSALAITAALRQLGKSVECVFPSGVSTRYEFLLRRSPGDSAKIIGENGTLDDLQLPDAIIAVDTSAQRQLLPVWPFLERFAGPVAIIDHHKRSDLRASVEIIDDTAPAAGLVVERAIRHLNVTLTRDIAELLLIAVATDTGWFGYANTSGECFAAASRYSAAGADLNAIHDQLIFCESRARFLLTTRTLNSAELLCDERLVVFTLTQRDFADCDADTSHTENLIDQASRLASMQMAVMFVEVDAGLTRVNFRSRGTIDVHQLATRYGGGGHRLAAGAKIPGALADVKRTVLADAVNLFAAPTKP